MKTHLKTTLMGMIFVQVITLVAPAAFAGGQNGNGGGGVNRNGRMMSFYSAGLFAEPTLDSSDVPQLDNLIKTVSNMAVFSSWTRSQIMAALIPSSTRRYMKVKKFDTAARMRILEEFSRVTKVNTTDLELFAVTDVKTKTTFLLPSFDTLSDMDKMAILFHEAYWIMNPTASYAQVVDAEMSFQAVLADPTNLNRQMNLVTKAGNPLRDPLYFAYKKDLASGALKPLMRKDGRIYLDDLFDLPKSDYGRVDFQRQLEAPVKWSQKLPNSLTLKLLIKAIAQDQIAILSAPYNFILNFIIGRDCYLHSDIAETVDKGAIEVRCNKKQDPNEYQLLFFFAE